MISKLGLLAFTLLLLDAPTSTMAIGQTGVSTLTVTSYSCSKLYGLPVVAIACFSPNPSQFTAIVYGVMHNSIGQTVRYTTATLIFQGPSTEGWRGDLCDKSTLLFNLTVNIPHLVV